MPHRPLLILVGLLVLGCGDLLSHFNGDAGTHFDATQGLDGAVPMDGGTPDAAVSDAGTADAGANDAGDPFDAGTDSGSDAGATDAGSRDAGPQGDGLPLTWTANLADAGDHIYTGVGGTSATDFYVIGSSVGTTTISHYDGNGLSPVFIDPTLALGSLTGFWVSSAGEVFAGGPNYLMACASNCAAGGDYVESSLNTEAAQGLCGTGGSQGTQAYAVGQDMGTLQGLLWAWNGAAWPLLSADAGAQSFTSCWVAPDGDVFVAATGAVAHFDSAGDLLAVETPPISSSVRLQAIWGAEGVVYAAGDEATVVARATDGTWSIALGPQGSAGTFHAMGSAASNEVWVGGFPVSSVPQYSQAHLFNGAWSYENDFGGLLNMYGIWSPDVNTVIVAGQQLDSLGGIVGAALYVGTR
jgi:hypothetical protein